MEKKVSITTTKYEKKSRRNNNPNYNARSLPSLFLSLSLSVYT